MDRCFQLNYLAAEASIPHSRWGRGGEGGSGRGSEGGGWRQRAGPPCVIALFPMRQILPRRVCPSSPPVSVLESVKVVVCSTLGTVRRTCIHF
jgi:hypothetical protein